MISMQKLLSFFVVVFLCAVSLPVQAAEAPISRRDGFLLIWNSIRRETEDSSEKRFADVPKDAPGDREIRFAKERGILDDDDENFHPDEPLSYYDGLVWLLRTRSFDDDEGGDLLYGQDPRKSELANNFLTSTVRRLGLRYVEVLEETEPSILRGSFSREELASTASFIDAYLRDETHEVSLYAEKFHGKGTAFGESFDMHALTAAHRTFPHNTLVEVTNVTNGKSVTVRINDRGPYVSGRDMDLSLAAFTSIADRSQGKFNAKFRRLGDANLVSFCEGSPRAIRLGRETRLQPGIPFALPLGNSLNLRANLPFVVRSVQYPDGTVTRLENWILKDENFTLKPSITGLYTFRLSSKSGETRDIPMRVVSCQ